MAAVQAPEQQWRHVFFYYGLLRHSRRHVHQRYGPVRLFFSHALGVCVGQPRNCSDTHECTTDSCDEDGNRCVHTPVNSRCVDSVMCTIDVCEVGQGCVHTPSDALCEDTVECTLHVCNASTGCEVSYNHTACADDDACTRDECTTTGCNHLTDYTLPGCVPPPSSSSLVFIRVSVTCVAITGCFLNPMEICKAGEYCSTAASKCIACQGGSSPNAQKTACIADNGTMQNGNILSILTHSQPFPATNPHPYAPAISTVSPTRIAAPSATRTRSPAPIAQLV